MFVIALMPARARADEIWVAPTAQQDLGGLGIGSNVIWPATAAGAVRLAWSVPDNLQSFTNAKLVLIPHGAGSEGLLHIYVCPAQSNDLVLANCAAPPPVAYAGAPNRLVEVDISDAIGASVGTAGVSYLAVLAYTTPTTATDHIVGLRFEYEAKTPAGVATTGANTFSGMQIAPVFIGSGAGLTNVPFPAGAATLGANTFTGTQSAPAFSGSGASLLGVAKLTANFFNGTQTILGGNLDLEYSTAATGSITKTGVRFLHNFGSANTFLGVGAGNYVMSGYNNAAVGGDALAANTSGLQNAALGVRSLPANTTGYNNTAIGYSALFSNQDGRDNLALGVAAGYYVTGSYNIDLAHNGFAGESNTMRLGIEGAQTKTFIAGIRSATTGAANAIPVVIDSNGQLGTVSSSVRFKEDVHDMADASRRLLQLRPVTFRYTQAYIDGAKPIQYGLIAEEVAEVFPELAVRDADGRVETVHYETLNVLLVNEVQKQQQRIDALEQKVNDLLDRLP
jgi:hypothetical protein